MGLLFAVVHRPTPGSPELPAPITGSAEPRVAGEHSEGHRDVQRIMFVGASVTRGWFASSLSRAFPETLAAMLPTPQQDVLWTVLADPGAPVDVAERWQFRPLREYDTRYRALLRRILDASPRVRLFCLGDWGRIGAVNRLGVIAYSYDSTVSAACADDGGTYVPINQNYDVPGARGPRGRQTGFGISDDFHPNDLGHMLIAQTVMQGLQGHPPAEPVPPPGAPSQAPILPRPTPGTPPDTRSGRTTQ